MPIFAHRPTAENLIPIRLDIEIDGQRYKDAFTWNPSGKFCLRSNYCLICKTQYEMLLYNVMMGLISFFFFFFLKYGRKIQVLWQLLIPFELTGSVPQVVSCHCSIFIFFSGRQITRLQDYR